MIRLKLDTSRHMRNHLKTFIQTQRSLTNFPRKSNFSSNGHSQRDDASEQASNLRLSKVTEILKEEKSFQRTSSKIDEIYSKGKSKIFEDLRFSLHQKHYIAKVMCRGFTQSRSMRGFYLDQLFKCIYNEEYQSFSTGVKIMERSSLLNVYERLLAMEIESATFNHQENTTALGSKESSPGKMSECLELLILISVTSGEPLVGALFALHSMDLPAQVKTETLERLISALSIYDPLLNNYHSFAIFKILKCYERLYSPKVILAAIRSMSSSQNPYFANLLHDKFQKRYEANSSISEMVIETRKSLVKANLNHGNYHRAAELWKLNQKANTQFAEKNVFLFQSLLEKIPDDMIVEDLLINHFPRSLYNDPDFVDFSLSYFGQREKYRIQFEYVTKSLKPPLKRNTLSLLFSSFIFQDREEASEKILQVILKTKNGLNSEDFLVIINKLLAKNQINKCVEMCIVNDFRVSYKGSMKVMEYLLTHTKLTEKKEAENATHGNYELIKVSFMETLVKNLYKQINDKKVYHLFTTTIFRHFSAHINNRATRKLYLNLGYTINKADNQTVNLLAYEVPSELGKFLLIDNDNRMECLEIILRKAVEAKDSEIIAWCASELQNNGIPVVDIEKYYLGVPQ